MIRTAFQTFFLMCIVTANAQFGPQQIISSNTDKAYISIPLDIDNDGYIDVLKSSVEDYKLQWHRNLDGEGNFGPEILITDTPASYLIFYFIDLDSDGDKDLLYLENNPRNFEWFENLDGEGNFGTEQTILESPQDFIYDIKVEDIDNDGDKDLIAIRSSTFTDRLVWYENLDGLGNFGTENILVEGNVLTFSSMQVVDIDNDGKLDILAAQEFFSGPGKLIWYKNLGGAAFDTEREIYQFLFLSSDMTSIYSIKHVDINTDGKKDIVITAHNDDTGTFYHWFENIDDQGNFGPIRNLPMSAYFCDLDGDGDNDMLAGNRFVNRIYWIENTDGLGAFSKEHTISTEIDFLKDIKAADFNGDGLLDVVSASLGDDKVAWYENTGVLGVSENIQNQFKVFPNPTQNEVTIISKENIEVIDLFDDLGKKIRTLKNTNNINLNDLVSGIYFVKIISKKGTSGIHKIIKI